MSYEIYGKMPSTLGKGVLAESSGGALMYYVMVTPNERNDVPETRGGFCLVKKDGEMMQGNVQNLIKVLGGLWDGKDIAALEAIDPTGIQVIAEWGDTAPKPKRDGSGDISYTEVKNVYPLGGGGGLGLPDAVDAKSVAAKYGSKFRAAFGTTKPAARPAASAAPTPPAKPAAPPPARTPPAPRTTVSPSTFQACWDATYAKLTGYGAGDQFVNDWWLKETAGFGDDLTAVEPAKWGALMAKVEALTQGDVDLPF
jgi:hypothetical protein